MTKPLLILYFSCFYFALSELSNIELANPLNSTRGVLIRTGFAPKCDGAGDINGDGIQDIIISDEFRAIYVLYGKSSFIAPTAISPSVGFKITTTQTTGHGSVVSRAGDMNGDGIDDLVFADKTAGASSGIVYVLFGSRNPGVLIDLMPTDLVNLAANGRGFCIMGGSSAALGGSVSEAGDVNGDGADDIIIGADGENKAYVIFGSKVTGFLTDITDSALPSIVANNRGFSISGGTSFGVSVSGAGDVNGDGADDILIGESINSKAYVIFGSKTAGALTDISSANIPNLYANGRGFQIEGPASSQLGTSVSHAGDVNGDGVGDIIVGAPQTNSNKGAAYVIFGKRAPGILTNIAQTDLPNLFTSGKGFAMTSGLTIYFGTSVGAAGDINVDGISDIIVGGMGSISSSATAYVIYGNRTRRALVDLGPTDIDTLFSLGKGFQVKERPSTFGIIAVGGELDLNNDHRTDAIMVNQDGIAILYGEPGPVVSRSSTMEAVVEGLAKAAQVTALATAAVTLISFNNPGIIILFASAEVFKILDLMKINYPPRLQDLLDNPASSDTIFTDLLATPESVIYDIPLQPLPYKFEKAGFHSSFLVNFWPSLIPLISILVLAIFVSLVKLRTSSRKKDSSVKKAFLWMYSKLTEAVKWNLMLSVFTGYFGDISLYSALEFKTAQFDFVSEWLSFGLCLLINLAALFWQVKIFLVNYKLRKARVQSKQAKDPKIVKTIKEDLKEYEIVFESFKENSFLQQSFVSIFNIKIYIFYAAIAYFPDYPLVPTLVNSLIGFSVLLYLIIARPQKEWLELAHFIFAELIFVLMSICTVCLALDEAYDDITLGEGRVTIGDIIIVCNSLFMLVVTLFSLVQIFNIFRDLYRFTRNLLRRKGSQNRVVPAQKDDSSQNIVTTVQPDHSSLNISNSLQTQQQNIAINLDTSEQFDTMIQSPSPSKYNSSLKGKVERLKIKNAINSKRERPKELSEEYLRNNDLDLSKASQPETNESSYQADRNRMIGPRPNRYGRLERKRSNKKRQHAG